MNTPLAFISFDIDHNQLAKTQFVAEAGCCSTTFSVDDWSAEDKSPRSDWEKFVDGKIGRCDFMIVLVGAHMDEAPRVEREIEFARQRNVPYFGVYVGGAGAECSLPAGLPANRTIPCDWNRIGSAVDQLMKEGKNHIFH